jgi:hypothetical protein
MDSGIKFRPVKISSARLKGGVETAQKTDLGEFYSAGSLDWPDLEDHLDLWQHFYNWHRPHGGLNSNSPMERYTEPIYGAPLSGEVDAMYDPSKERIRVSDYRRDLRLHRLRLSV